MGANAGFRADALAERACSYSGRPWPFAPDEARLWRFKNSGVVFVAVIKLYRPDSGVSMASGGVRSPL
jgi:hypothetical protein